MSSPPSLIAPPDTVIPPSLKSYKPECLMKRSYETEEDFNKEASKGIDSDILGSTSSRKEMVSAGIAVETTATVFAPRPIKLRRRQRSLASALMTPSKNISDDANSHTILVPSPALNYSSSAYMTNLDNSHDDRVISNKDTVEELFQIMKSSSLVGVKSNESASRTTSRSTTPVTQNTSTPISCETNGSPRTIPSVGASARLSSSPAPKLPDVYYTFPKSPISRIARNPVVLNSSFYS